MRWLFVFKNFFHRTLLEAVTPIAHNGYALAHPKGLVAFLPLKINKEKKAIADQCGVKYQFIFSF